LQFKGTQFISVGIVRLVVGYTFFLGCVSAPADPGDHKCEEFGPGSHANIFPTAIGFICQVVLVWTALALLRCSSEKGRSMLQGNLTHQTEGHATVAGGYIRYFLWYDLFWFTVCMCILVYVGTTVKKYDGWVVGHSIYAVQVLYGLMSFPFFLFTLPMLQRVLTHAMPTAYDRRGACRRLAPSAAVTEKHQQAPQESEADARVSDTEVNSILEDVKSTLPGQFKDMAQDAASKAITGVVTSLHAAAGGKLQAKQVVSEGKDKLKKGISYIKQLLERWIKSKIHVLAGHLVDRLPGLAKDMLEDPDMPRGVSRVKNRLVDSVWPDIREEIMWEVAVLIDGQVPSNDKLERNHGPDCVRAFFRYHLFPYNKGFWGKLRDPCFVLLTLVSLVPIFGVSPGYFFFIFLIIDKSDEFQLVQFILVFKGIQFLSVGLIRTITGYVMYLMCATAPAHDTEHSCENAGPGTQGDILATSAGFVLQIILVWAAFLMLQCSAKKGRSQLGGAVLHESTGHGSVAGGYIRYLIVYDFLVFTVCIGIFAWAFTTVESYADWPLEHTVFALQALYGLSALPFFFFTLPLLQRVLTHALPTAYDEHGCCCKPALSVALEGKHREGLEKQHSSLVKIQDIEISDILDKVLEVLPDKLRGFLKSDTADPQLDAQRPDSPDPEAAPEK